MLLEMAACLRALLKLCWSLCLRDEHWQYVFLVVTTDSYYRVDLLVSSFKIGCDQPYLTALLLAV